MLGTCIRTWYVVGCVAFLWAVVPPVSSYRFYQKTRIERYDNEGQLFKHIILQDSFLLGIWLCWTPVVSITLFGAFISTHHPLHSVLHTSHGLSLGITPVAATPVVWSRFWALIGTHVVIFGYWDGLGGQIGCLNRIGCQAHQQACQHKVWW